MSLVWIDGFDNQNLSRWTIGGTPTFVAGRIGGYGVEFNASGEYIARPFPPMTTLSFGCAAKIVSNSGNAIRFSVKDAALGSIPFSNIQGDTTGWSIQHCIGSSSSRTTSLGQPQRLGVWEHIEIAYVQHLTTGSISVRFNGVTVYNYSGNTTWNTTLLPVSNFYCDSSQSGVNCVLDDVWVSTGELYGDCRVRGLVPTADSTKGWTPSTGTDHYALVDDTTPSMTDYVSATTGSGAIDTFTLTVPGDITSVQAVQVVAYGLKTDVGPAPLRLLADGQESADLGPSTGAAAMDALFPTASGAAAWTPAKLAAVGVLGIKAV